MTFWVWLSRVPPGPHMEAPRTLWAPVLLFTKERSVGVFCLCDPFLSPRKLIQRSLSQVSPGWTSQCSEESLKKTYGPLVLTGQPGGVENMVN